MSKRFPAIRFHGNNLACARHIKRGMLELFKTEQLQKKMGVPVLRRTIEVSDYTTIMVHIAKEQTFIHITSNPPSLPEVVAVTEEKEVEGYLCPYSFLIRKRDPSVKGMPSINFDADGYLIAYDHTEKNWRVASFKGKDGSTVPYAANLGWYPETSDAATGYTKCDVVTWHGQSSPDFNPPFWNKSSIGGPYHMLKNVFYFQGRKLSAPGLVAGACILEAEGPEGRIKYFYVHVATLSLHTYGGVDSFRCVDRSYRKPYTDVMAGTSGGWDLLTSIDYSSSGLPYDQYANGFYGPRSCSYISQDGLAYFIREFECPSQTVFGPAVAPYTPRGLSAFIEFNLRTGQYKILSDITSYAATVTSTRETDFENDYEYGHVQTERAPTPWVFYVWPGTQDLYHATYSVESNSEFVQSGTNFSSAHYFDASITVYKNFKIFKEIPFFRAAGGQRFTDNPNTGQIYGREFFSQHYLEYHPDIPKATRMIETTDSVGSELVTVYLKQTVGPTQLLFSESHEPYRLTNSEQSGLPDGYLPWGVPAFVPIQTAGVEVNPYFLNHCTYNYSGAELRHGLAFYHSSGSGTGAAISSFTSSVWAEPTKTYVSIWAGAIAGGFGQTCGTNYRNNAVLYGSAGTINSVARLADGENTTFFHPDCYAIHRQIPGMAERPYLYLRKKIRGQFVPSTATTYTTLPVFNPGSQSQYAYETRDSAPTELNITLWSKPSGGYSAVPEDPQDPNVYLDTEEYELLSNFTSAEELNQMTDEIGNAFFDIGIL